MFIARYAHPDSDDTIMGYGLSAQAAVQEAYDATGMAPSRVELGHETGLYIVRNDVTHAEPEFEDRDEAVEYARQQGFVALRCTERLYRWIEERGIPDRWTINEDNFADLCDVTP